MIERNHGFQHSVEEGCDIGLKIFFVQANGIVGFGGLNMFL